MTDTMALLGGDPTAPPADDPTPELQADPGADPAAPAGPGEEIDIILGYGDTLTLKSGTLVHLRPLKSMELMAALRVILKGVGPDMFTSLDPDAPTSELVGKFASLLMAGMLHATDEMIGFVRMMVEPANLPGGRLDKAQQARVDAVKAALAEEMANPDPEDLVRIVAAVAQRDGADVVALGKLLAGVIRMFQRSGLIPVIPDIPGLNLVGGMAATFDLLSSEYGWTDAEILNLPLRRIRQAVAAIQARRWALDLAHRRLETAKLRTLASYIACGYDIAEGHDNKMLLWAPGLALGDGCGNPTVDIPDADDPPQAADAGPVRVGNRPGPARPGAARRFRLPADTPDTPAPVRVGQKAPMPAGIREVPAGDVGRILRGLT